MAITIIGNVGNVGYAIPMVSAVPINVNLQYLLAWSPVAQALDYVPFTIDTLGNATVLKDLAVGEDLTVAATATIAGATTVGNGLTVTGAVTSTAGVTAGAGATAASITPGVTPQLSMSGTKVVETRKTGWVVMTGTPSRATKDTASVTLPQLAAIVMALEQDLISHGLIGT